MQNETTQLVITQHNTTFRKQVSTSAANELQRFFLQFLLIFVVVFTVHCIVSCAHCKRIAHFVIVAHCKINTVCKKNYACQTDRYNMYVQCKKNASI